MNTSKATASKKPATDFNNPEEFTETEKEQLAAKLPADTNNAPAATSPDDIDALFEKGEKVETGQAQELTAIYIDFNEFAMDEERNYLFTAHTTFVTDKGESKPAVKLMDKDRVNYICASTVVVKSLMNVETIPCLVRIKVSGKEKGKNGSYFNAKVFLL